MIEIHLDRDADEPLYLQIAAALARAIDGGELPPGDKLPTVRELASSLGITRVTVHNAFARLQEEGRIVSTVGRGSFVSRGAAAGAGFSPPAAPDGWSGSEDAALRILLSRDIGSLALAEPDPGLAPAEEFMDVLGKVSEHALALLRYGATEGDPDLRARIAALLGERGVVCAPEEILMTMGSTQAMSLVVQALARPGERVLVEQPTYFGFLSIARALGVQPVPVAMDEEGPLPDALERAVLRERPRLFYTMPTFHNPTGITMSARRRAEILEISARYSLPILEDDIFRSLAYEKKPPPPLKPADERGLVFYVDSFSKNLLPGLRIGFVVAPRAQHAKLSSLLYASTMGTAHILQRALSVFLAEGRFDAHLRRVVPLYRKRRDALLQSLAREMPEGVAWTSPAGGFCCWVRLPGALSVESIQRKALGRGVGFTPGRLFEAQPAGGSQIRLCFGTQRPEAIRASVAGLAAVIREEAAAGTAAPSRPARIAPLV